MKKSAISILVSGMCIAGLCSCSGGGNPESDGVINEFKVEQVIKSAERDYLCEGAWFSDSVGVYSKVNVAVEWPEKMGSYDIKPLQDTLIALSFIHPERTIDQSIIKALDSPQGSDTYKMVMVDSISASVKAMVLYRGTVVSSIAYSPRFIVYQIMTSSYEGGAHGLTLSQFLNYDFVEGKVIDFDNAFKPGSHEALFSAVKNKLMADNGVESLAELGSKGFFTDQLFLSHNFYLQGYDVVFHYHPYDIAPYSTGAVDVRVPFYVISDYLSPEVMDILSKDSF